MNSLWFRLRRSPLSYSEPSSSASSSYKSRFALSLCCHFYGISDGVFRKQAITSGKIEAEHKKPTRKIWIAILCAQIIYLQPSVGVARVFVCIFSSLFVLGCLQKSRKQVGWECPEKFADEEGNRENTAPKKSTQIRCCYHHSLIAAPALYVRVLYVSACSMDFSLSFFTSLSLTIYPLPLSPIIKCWINKQLVHTKCTDRWFHHYEHFRSVFFAYSVSFSPAYARCSRFYLRLSFYFCFLYGSLLHI